MECIERRSDNNDAWRRWTGDGSRSREKIADCGWEGNKSISLKNLLEKLLKPSTGGWLTASDSHCSWWIFRPNEGGEMLTADRGKRTQCMHQQQQQTSNLFQWWKAELKGKSSSKSRGGFCCSLTSILFSAVFLIVLFAVSLKIRNSKFTIHFSNYWTRKSKGDELQKHRKHKKNR